MEEQTNIKMKLYHVSGLLPMHNDSAKQFVSHSEYILAKDESTAIEKYQEVHPSCIKDEGFTTADYICNRDSIIPTVEPVAERCSECSEIIEDCECEVEFTFTLDEES